MATMKKQHLVFNIGCIECGVSSNIVGIFDSKDRAEYIAKVCQKKFSWRQQGQNRFEVFELPTPGVIASEYDLGEEESP